MEKACVGSTAPSRRLRSSGPIAASLVVFAGLLVALRKKIVAQLRALRTRLAPPAAAIVTTTPTLPITEPVHEEE